jgi:hypothetical protein
MKGYKEINTCYNCYHANWLCSYHDHAPDMMICGYGKDKAFLLEVNRKFGEGLSVPEDIVVEPNGLCKYHKRQS